MLFITLDLLFCNVTGACDSEGLLRSDARGSVRPGGDNQFDMP